MGEGKVGEGKRREGKGGAGSGREGIREGRAPSFVLAPQLCKPGAGAAVPGQEECPMTEKQPRNSQCELLCPLKHQRAARCKLMPR